MNDRCKSCGAKIEWKVLRSGKRCPMQRVRSVYVGPEGSNEVGSLSLNMLRLREDGEFEDSEMPLPPMYVSHFETCPNASQHSKRGER